MKEKIKNKQKRVIAIVVTFNRKELLARCIQKICEQTFSVEKIVIFDNCSSDDSFGFIKDNFQEYFLPDAKLRIQWLRSESNVGGAGGFETALRYSQQNDKADYYWLMDDDGYPEKECLEQLMKFSVSDCFIGPLVLSDKDYLSLSFPIRMRGTLNVIDTKDSPYLKEKKVLLGHVSPFNGTLIGRLLVESIGYPNGNFFIWGDEVDYMERARKITKNLFTLPAAIFYHPRRSNVGRKMCFGLLRFNDPESELKLFCYVRNNFYNLKNYRGSFASFLFSGKVLWYYTFTNLDLKRLRVSFFALFDGLRGDFSRHSFYLKSK